MKALVLVDLQNDFMPYGALPVANGDDVVPIANALIPRFEIVIASQDWHPANHGSFASQHPGAAPGDVGELRGRPQVLWPDHCVQNAPGASFHSGLDIAGIHYVVRKGTDPTIDSYSVFYDNHHLKATGLESYLTARRVTDIVLVGLATDYCVRYSALDALFAGFRVTVVTDAVRAVNLSPADGESALGEIAEAGGRLVTSGEL